MIVRLIVLFMVVFIGVTTANGNSIKVLIIDDVFVNVPDENEKIEKMGKIHGDLLVNGNHYRGNIEVWKGKTGLYLVNELSLEDYVKNVVRAEVGINWHAEALKAQAVIVRTYALYKIATNSQNHNYDLTSSVLHQVYKGSQIDPRISSAVTQTKDEVLYFNGRLIESLYHSTCGGRTEKPEEVFSTMYPYLKSVESNCEISPYWIWERRIPINEIEKALDISGIKDIAIESYTSTRRVKTLKATHSSGTLSIETKELRKLLGWKRLPSTKFDLSRYGDEIIFDGKGYGHGVGLCQWSALQMARDGMNYKEILAYFYPGTSIQLYENR